MLCIIAPRMSNKLTFSVRTAGTILLQNISPSSSSSSCSSSSNCISSVSLHCRSIRVFSTKPTSPAKKEKTPAPKGGVTNANKAKKVTKKDNAKTLAEHLTKFMLSAEEAKRFKPVFTEEELAEHAKIGRIFQQKTTQQHNRLQKDLSTKIWLQQDAMRAMPDHLRAKAEIVDDTPPPPDRPWPIWMTPPIKDFDAKKFMGKEDQDEDDEEIAEAEKASAK